MTLSDLHAKRGKTPRLSAVEVEALRGEVPAWSVVAAEAHLELRRTLKFADFAALMAFVNKLATLAEAEDHHPDFSVHYSRLDLVLWTHDAGGLTKNDFILAAKLDALGT